MCITFVCLTGIVQFVDFPKMGPTFVRSAHLCYTLFIERVPYHLTLFACIYAGNHPEMRCRHS